MTFRHTIRLWVMARRPPNHLTAYNRLLSWLDEKRRDNTPGCWQWNEGLDQDGYALVYLPREGAPQKRVGVHRIAFDLFVGPIPDGFDVHHECNVRNCANPQHLKALPKAVHAMIADAAPALNSRRKCCSRCGGMFTQYTRRHPNGRVAVSRRCRPCGSARAAARQRGNQNVVAYRRGWWRANKQRLLAELRHRRATDPEFRARERGSKLRYRARNKSGTITLADTLTAPNV